MLEAGRSWGGGKGVQYTWQGRGRGERLGVGVGEWGGGVKGAGGLRGQGGWGGGFRLSCLKVVAFWPPFTA